MNLAVGVALDAVMVQAIAKLCGAFMKILYVWEWGGGLSHLYRFHPLAEELASAGHELLVATRDLSHVREIFPPQLAKVCQAPTFTGKLGDNLDFPQTFADLAWNLGFNSPSRVAAQIEVYRDLMRQHQTDIVISDFGLSASIAAATLGLKRIRIGTGYECPPLTRPLVPMRFADRPRTGEPESSERAVARIVNEALNRLHLKELESVSQMIGDAGHTLLATIEETDPYVGSDPSREYLGVWDHGGDVAPTWPSGQGPRVFAYLKPFPTLGKLFDSLKRMRCRIALVSDGVPDVMIKAGGEQITVQDGPVDLYQATDQCDFAITNSTHGVSIRMLSLGAPVVGFPLFMEQRIVARCLQAKRLALHLNVRDDTHLHEAILRAQSEAAKQAVGQFAERVQPFLQGSRDRAVDSLLRLL